VILGHDGGINPAKSGKDRCRTSIVSESNIVKVGTNIVLRQSQTHEGTSYG